MGTERVSVARSASGCQMPWQDALKGAWRDLAALAQRLDLDPVRLNCGALAHRDYPLCVPEPFVARIERGNLDDPLLRQILPLAAECQTVAGFCADPLAEHAHVADGLLQKYARRALLLTTRQCAIHCRYCFRRGQRQLAMPPVRWQERLATLSEIDELILSGGDPLMLNDRRLGQLLGLCQAVPGLKRLRLHTRLPIVLPSRVTAELCSMLTRIRLPLSLVVHVNHPAELDDSTAQALAQLRTAGVTLLNQSVLLRGVNDHPQPLIALCETLFAQGVLPYYLHLLDPVVGSAHFQVSTAHAQALMQALRAQLPGYLVPRAVREVNAQPNKVPLAEWE